MNQYKEKLTIQHLLVLILEKHYQYRKKYISMVHLVFSNNTKKIILNYFCQTVNNNLNKNAPLLNLKYVVISYLKSRREKILTNEMNSFSGKPMVRILLV